MRSNVFMQWMRWRFFLLGRFFERLLSFSGKARQEAAQYDKGLPRSGRSALEDIRSSEFYEFYNSIDGAQFSSFNAIFVMLFASVVFIGVLPFLPVEAQISAWANYLAWMALAVCVIALMRIAFSKSIVEGAVTEQQYEKDKQFLYDIGEESKQEQPLFVTIALWAMLLVDAAMICVVVMDYASDLPRKYALYGGLATGLVVAFILDFLNRNAGASLYREHHRRRLARTITTEGGMQKSEVAQGIRSVVRHFDVSEEGFLRRYGHLTLSVVAMIVIAALAFEARYSLNVNVIQEEISYSVSSQTQDITLPPSVAGQQQANVNAIAQNTGANAEKAMMASLIILSLIFLAIQFVVGASGYKYAFYHDASENAYRRVRRYESAAAHRAADGEIRSAGQELVCMRANSFLASYYSALVKKAHARVGAELLEDLEERGGALKFEDYVFERETAPVKSTAKPRPRAAADGESDDQPAPKTRRRSAVAAAAPVEAAEAPKPKTRSRTVASAEEEAPAKPTRRRKVDA